MPGVGVKKTSRSLERNWIVRSSGFNSPAANLVISITLDRIKLSGLTSRKWRLLHERSLMFWLVLNPAILKSGPNEPLPPALIAAFISLTASSIPTKIARATMLWPMLNSVISGIAPPPQHSCKLVHVQPQRAIHIDVPALRLLSIFLTPGQHELRLRRGFRARPVCFSVSSSTQLNLLCADFVRGLDLRGSGSMKRLASISPCRSRATVARTIAIFVSHVKTAFSGDLIRFLCNQSDGVGFCVERNL